MLYREIMAVGSQLHTKHINTLSGQNVALLNVKLLVYRYNPKHLYPKMNGCGDNGQRSLKL
jgi:hypothetical protein